MHQAGHKRDSGEFPNICVHSLASSGTPTRSSTLARSRLTASPALASSGAAPGRTPATRMTPASSRTSAYSSLTSSTAPTRSWALPRSRPATSPAPASS
eukprot:3118244-Alexandrium_andersonii.AAC.1